MAAGKAKEPLRVGLFVGREWSWPPAFIEEVNRRDEGVVAEYVKIAGTMMNEPCPYRVIVDRISHEVPYYRSYLKNAALQGAKVVNDPFMWTADDKFFDASLAMKLGVAHPKTVVLPNKDYVPGIVHSESLRNLKYPMDWEAVVAQVGGFPCVLKDAHGGGWKGVYVVHSMPELIWRYNESGLLTMVLQEFIQWQDYARCYVLGQNDVHVMRYKPGQHGAAVYYNDHGFPPELEQRLIRDCIVLAEALGYDMNACEFAIRDGIPYAIDFMNPAPDMDVNSLGKVNFDWMVTHMADMCIRLAKSKEETRSRYYWGKMIKGQAAKKGQ
jgi:glutathione synthase/RimK-type ligase-like ATP-grasp enzyme